MVFLTTVGFIGIALCAIAKVFGLLNLDKKIYWGDETFTSLRLSGYTTIANEAKRTQ
ncbi:hypothetical protein [Nostoc sp.]|uniref:hypothetical protein n=1 Tax=Nostoc sp. TaxID=1180 RepID=UPI002FF5B5D4